MAVLLFNVAYEVVLYVVPIPTGLYRLIALRYILLLALGCAVYQRTKTEGQKGVSPVLIILSLMFGFAYLVFFEVNRRNTELFVYGHWANSNVFCSFYIAPIFYVIMHFFRNYQLKPMWLHRLVSTVGQSSYYILCTQMVMFWAMDKVKTLVDIPLWMFIILNILLSVSSGLFVNSVVKNEGKSVDIKIN